MLLIIEVAVVVVTIEVVVTVAEAALDAGVARVPDSAAELVVLVVVTVVTDIVDDCDDAVPMQILMGLRTLSGRVGSVAFSTEKVDAVEVDKGGDADVSCEVEVVVSAITLLSLCSVKL